MHGEDEALVDDAVHKAVGLDRIGKVLVPLLDIDLSDDNQGLLFVALLDYGPNLGRNFFAHGTDAELLNDQKLLAAQALAVIEGTVRLLSGFNLAASNSQNGTTFLSNWNTSFWLLPLA